MSPTQLNVSINASIHFQASSFFGMKEEVDNVKNVKACSPGFGAAVNCILPLVNIQDDYESRKYGMSGVNSSTSPGAGAFTPYYGRRWKAKRYIPAGMELYGNYGEGYFKTRSEYDHIPLKENYKVVDTLLSAYRSLIRVLWDNKTKSTNNGDELTTITAPKDWRVDLLGILQSLPGIWDESRDMKALPKAINDLSAIDWLLEFGSGFQHYNTSIRSLEWLEQNGRCMDNIKEGISTIEHAGRGAFAYRFIPEGGIVSPAPLIHIPNREIFNIYAGRHQRTRKKDGTIYDKFVADHGRPLHHQLLLNYCFGHKESSLLVSCQRRIRIQIVLLNFA